MNAMIPAAKPMMPEIRVSKPTLDSSLSSEVLVGGVVMLEISC